jgi:Transglutaminase-like superfamily
MKNHPIIGACWFAVNTLLVVSLVAVLYSVGWEFSTRSYLKGFSDAIIPASDNPEQKAEAILQWMAHGPARRSEADPGGLAARNPEDTLNIQHLLEVCGTATNAFVNLAQSSGLRARRLLLLDPYGQSKHVVVEVLFGDLWVVVDPSYHYIMRLPDGHFATRAELKDPPSFGQRRNRYPTIRRSIRTKTRCMCAWRAFHGSGGACAEFLILCGLPGKNRSIGRCSWSANPSPRWSRLFSFSVFRLRRDSFWAGIAGASWASRANACAIKSCARAMSWPEVPNNSEFA